jgi:dTDP-4-dehydrorhamnose 3,5-epimerase
MFREKVLIFTHQSIADIILVSPTIHGDTRGYFMETFRQDLFEEFIGYRINLVQDNESKSSKGVLRGLHYQIQPYSQSKLIRVLQGSILDVAVDIRRSSPTFGKHVSVKLTSENKHQLFIPKGFAHGFIVLSDEATITYKVDNYYSKEHDRGIAFDDKELKIDWIIPDENISLSEKDKIQPNLKDALELF